MLLLWKGDKLSYQNIKMDFKTLTCKTSSLREHFHSGYEIIFVTQGASKFTINDNVSTCNKNSLLFLNDLEKHKMDLIDTPYSRYMIIIESDYLNNIIKDPVLLSIFKNRWENPGNEFNIKNKHVKFINDTFYNLYQIYSKMDNYWHMEFISILCNLIIFLYREYPGKFPLSHIRKSDQRMLDIQSFLDDNFKKDITLDSLSERFFISKYYLAHSYKKITGFTIKQYILLKRISFAKNQLYYTDDSVTDIAMACGFNSQSNFIRIFSQKEDMTPLQFRKYYRTTTDPT